MIKVFKIEILKELGAEKSGEPCPQCLIGLPPCKNAEPEINDTYLVDHGNALQCEKYQEHYSDLNALLEFYLSED